MTEFRRVAEVQLARVDNGDTITIKYLPFIWDTEHTMEACALAAAAQYLIDNTDVPTDVDFTPVYITTSPIQ